MWQYLRHCQYTMLCRLFDSILCGNTWDSVSKPYYVIYLMLCHVCGSAWDNVATPVEVVCLISHVARLCKDSIRRCLPMPRWVICSPLDCSWLASPVKGRVTFDPWNTVRIIIHFTFQLTLYETRGVKVRGYPKRAVWAALAVCLSIMTPAVWTGATQWAHHWHQQYSKPVNAVHLKAC